MGNPRFNNMLVGWGGAQYDTYVSNSGLCL